PLKITLENKISLFMQHLYNLKELEDEFKAVLQSKSLIRYYFKSNLEKQHLDLFYQLHSLKDIHLFLHNLLLNNQ
ncbi:MAG: hypothetical protein PSV35_08390, partial [bacterium]|nr:hypothetical protein [bacterium]